MTFASDLERHIASTKDKIDRTVRQAVVLAAQGVVLKSPVGNPELWAANANAHAMSSMDARLTFNAFIDEANASREPSEKKMRKLGKKRLAEGLKMQRTDYVGGRFRANWILGVGAPDTTTTEDTDKSGGPTIERIAAAMADQKAGGVYFVTNSLPYTMPLEYEGHSTQAPLGMVRITFTGLAQAVEAYAASLR